MKACVFTMLVLLAVALVPIANAQEIVAPFTPGWYIIEPTGEFAIIQLGTLELAGDSAADVLAYRQAAINRGGVGPHL